MLFEYPLRSSVPPLTDKPVLSGMPCWLASCSRPPATVVVPLYELLALRTNVPRPIFVSPPELDEFKTPAKVMFAEFVSMAMGAAAVLDLRRVIGRVAAQILQRAAGKGAGKVMVLPAGIATASAR